MENNILMKKVNGEYFTTIGKGHGAPCQPATKEDWNRWRNEPWLLQMCERIRKGDEELKHRLPVWTPHCAEFKNNHRAIADAVRPLNRLMLDFDEKGHTLDILSRLEMKDEPTVAGQREKQRLKMKDVHGMQVLLVEESVRGGTHVLVELPEGMEAEEAQELMKEVTGFEPDKTVKDVSRCIYMVPESYTRFVSEKFFSPEPLSEERRVKSEESNSVVPDSELKTQNCEAESSYPPNFEGIPYTRIIAEYWSMTGGIPTIGARNDKLHKLACNLRAICENKEDWLLEVMPRLGISEQEMKTIVHSACKEPTKGSKIMEQIVKKLHAEDTEDTEETSYFTLPASLKKNLAMGMKESLVGVPASMHMPVLCSVLPIAAAYADQVEVEYCDGNRQRLGLMSIIRGEQASGKSVCKMAVDVWKRQFDEEDAIARQREEEWKERKKGRKANEKAPDDPKY